LDTRQEPLTAPLARVTGSAATILPTSSKIAFCDIEALYLEKKRVSMSPFDKWNGADWRIFRATS
jgi:hypothetical protein